MHISENEIVIAVDKNDPPIYHLQHSYVNKAIQ